MRKLPLLAFLAIPLSAQPVPRFEVATVRPSQPITPKLLKQGLPIGKKVDGDRVSIGFVNMRGLLEWAYDVQAYQITGPDWIVQQRFDIAATMPAGSKPDQFAAMLRALLEERFHLKVRIEKREHPAYSLELAPSGSKLKEVQPLPKNPQGGVASTTAASTVNGDVFVSAEGTLRRMQGPNGLHMEWDGLTMPQILEKLTSLLAAPVSDRTNLNGRYPFTLDYPTGISPSELFAVINDSLDPQGLRLRRERAMIDHIVIESIDRMPTEN